MSNYRLIGDTVVIGIGTLVLILLIVLLVMALRGRTV